MKAGQRDVHFSPLKRSNLSTVKTAFVGKHVLSPSALQPKGPNPRSQALLNLSELHQRQFGGSLFKRILLIRRVLEDPNETCVPRALTGFDLGRLCRTNQPRNEFMGWSALLCLDRQLGSARTNPTRRIRRKHLVLDSDSLIQHPWIGNDTDHWNRDSQREHSVGTSEQLHYLQPASDVHKEGLSGVLGE